MNKRWCASAALLLAGCAVGPDYHRPALDLPGQYRDDPGAQSGADNAASVGDSGWWQVYSDPNLEALLNAAIKNNYDVKIAVARIDQARAQLGSTRLNFLPQLSVQAGAERAQGFPDTQVRPASRASTTRRKCNFWLRISSTCGASCGA